MRHPTMASDVNVQTLAPANSGPNPSLNPYIPTPTPAPEPPHLPHTPTRILSPNR